MIDTNELRRLAQAATPGPWSVVEYDHAICVQTESPSKSKYGASRYAAIGGFDRSDQVQLEEARANARIIAAANPAAITELLDRLEAAEKERDALRAEVIHIKEVEFPRKAQAVADGWRGKCERLEAKIAEMKRQEPVAWMTKLALEFGASRLVFQVSDVNIWGENGVPLYALPGAKGEMK